MASVKPRLPEWMSTPDVIRWVYGMKSKKVIYNQVVGAYRQLLLERYSSLQAVMTSATNFYRVLRASKKSLR